MYKVLQDATLLPLTLESQNYTMGGEKVKSISASASKDKNGKIHITIANVDHLNNINLNCEIRGLKINKVNGRILTSSKLTNHNTFEQPNNVIPIEFKGAKIKDNQLSIDLPAKSIVLLTLD